MTLYTLVNNAAKDAPQIIAAADKVNIPSYMTISQMLPFARFYLVSREKSKAEERAAKLNSLSDEASIDLRVRELSRIGVLRFYFEKYVLGNIPPFLSKAYDIDSSRQEVIGYVIAFMLLDVVRQGKTRSSF